MVVQPHNSFDLATTLDLGLCLRELMTRHCAGNLASGVRNYTDLEASASLPRGTRPRTPESRDAAGLLPA